MPGGIAICAGADNHRYYRAMSNLVPEQRTDKNGRVVTRHVKSSSAGKAAQSLIPSPSLPNDEGMSESVKKRISTSILKLAGIHGKETFAYGTGQGTRTLTYLARRAPSELRSLEKDLRDGSTWFRQHWGHTLNAINFTPQPVRNPEDEADTLPSFLQTKVIVATISELTEGEDIEPNAIGMRSAAFKGIIGKAGREDYATTRAALLAVWILPRLNNDGYGHLSDKDFTSVSYIKENYDTVMTHRHVLRQRGSIEPEVIGVIIDSDTSSLASGVL